MDTADRFLQEILATANRDGELVRNGYRAAELRIHPMLRNLAACFRKAQKDDTARIPSYLEAAITNLAAFLPPAEHKADWERDQSGTYDIDPRNGGQLRPGS